MNYTAVLAIFGVLFGCWSGVVFLEFVIKYDTGAGNLVTFLQFAFIALHGLVNTSKFFTVERKIPLKEYWTLVAMFFVSNCANNYALNLHISMPLNLIFRSSTLLANMVLGVIILKKRYDVTKYVSVGLLTAGIILCTFASGLSMKEAEQEASEEGISDFMWWVIGVIVITATLFLTARMGLYQEVLYQRCGKHPQEALFYTHVLPLPAFIFLSKNIYNHVVIASESPFYYIPIIGISVPIQFLYLAGNFLSHYVCIRSVYVLTTECSSLTVTLCVTLRKFLSLIFSVIYFKNTFTIYHWIGTFLVFVGTVLFTEIIPRIITSMRTPRNTILDREAALLLPSTRKISTPNSKSHIPVLITDAKKKYSKIKLLMNMGRSSNL